MPEYFTSDATEMPFPAIFKGGGCDWAWPLRLYFAFRKSVGWRFKPSFARAAPGHGVEVGLEQMSTTLRAGFSVRIAAVQSLGFTQIRLGRSDTIGRCVNYVCFLINAEQTTLGTIGAMRMMVGSMEATVWAVGFRTDLSDGRTFLTGSGRDGGRHILSARQQAEVLPEPTPVDEVFQLHQDRLRGIAHEQLVPIPKQTAVDFLVDRARSEFKEMLDRGIMRKLSPQEVDELQAVQFEFE